MHDFGGFAGIQTAAIASAIFASTEVKPLKLSRMTVGNGHIETEGEPPCLVRAVAEVERVSAMLAEGRAGRGMVKTASWAMGEKGVGRHLE